MILTSHAWKAAIKKYGLKNRDLDEMGSWVLQRYFGEENQKKPWFLPNLTPEQALQHLSDSPQSPITPDQLSDTWKVLPSLRAKLGREEADEELETVSMLLNKQTRRNTTTSNFSEAKLSELSDWFGDITKTMVNKIFVGAAQKLRDLTGGLSPEEMEDQDLKDLIERIDISREEAAEEFAATLKASNGNMWNFLEALRKTKQVSKVELRRVSPDELEVLKELSVALDALEIEQILLADIEEDDNFFLLFQNAASKKLFPNRAGRPKKGAAEEEATAEDDEETDELNSP
jgi:hypothetical protein